MTQTELIRMAIWMYNRVIERYPMIHEALKEEYLKELNDKRRDI